MALDRSQFRCRSHPEDSGAVNLNEFKDAGGCVSLPA
jgi:hypothetical protein